MGAWGRHHRSESGILSMGLCASIVVKIIITDQFQLNISIEVVFAALRFFRFTLKMANLAFAEKARANSVAITFQSQNFIVITL